LHPEMPEYAVEYRVQIQPVEILRILPVKPQQGAGLIVQVHPVGGQHPAPLVGHGLQGPQGLVQEPELQIQPAAQDGQHLAAHPGLPFLLGLGPRRLKGRVEVNGRFPRHGDRLLSLWGQKSKSYRRRRRGAAARAWYSASASRAAAWASPALWAAREAAARAGASITPSPSRAFSPSRSWARIRHSAA